MRPIVDVSQLPTKSVLALIVGVASATVLFTSANKSAEAQSKKTVTWEVTAVMVSPLNGSKLYRFEDPETRIVCYSRNDDLSGSVGCGKR